MRLAIAPAMESPPECEDRPLLKTRTTVHDIALSSQKATYSETNEMNIEAKFAGREVGYDVPAIPGMSEDEIQTPCLILDLDALEPNDEPVALTAQDALTAPEVEEEQKDPTSRERSYRGAASLPRPNWSRPLH